jgi:hypothetical protein
MMRGVPPRYLARLLGRAPRVGALSGPAFFVTVRGVPVASAERQLMKDYQNVAHE